MGTRKKHDIEVRWVFSLTQVLQWYEDATELHVFFLSGLVVTRVGEADRGSALALFTGIADLGAVVGSPLFGWMAERWSYTALYAVVAAGLALGVAIFWPWDRVRTRGPSSGRLS